MSAPTKAAAYRSGYRRALKDLRGRLDEIHEAVSLLQTVAGADASKVTGLKTVLSSLREFTWKQERTVEE